MREGASQYRPAPGEFGAGPTPSGVECFMVAAFPVLIVRPEGFEVARAVNEPHDVDSIGAFNPVDKTILPDEEFSDLWFAYF